MILLEDYTDLFLIKDSLIKGFCIYENCENEFDKRFCELLKTGAYCKICIKKVANERRKKTCLEKYGTDNITKRSEYKEKRISYNLQKYGVEYTFQSEKIKQKIKETNIVRYGVENPNKNIHIKT